jgi:hypothetical protein
MADFLMVLVVGLGLVAAASAQGAQYYRGGRKLR